MMDGVNNRNNELELNYKIVKSDLEKEIENLKAQLE